GNAPHGATKRLSSRRNLFRIVTNYHITPFHFLCAHCIGAFLRSCWLKCRASEMHPTFDLLPSRLLGSIGIRKVQTTSRKTLARRAPRGNIETEWAWSARRPQVRIRESLSP